MHEVTISSSSALVGCHPHNGNARNSQGHTSSSIVCHYCHKPGYMKMEYRKWLRNRGNSSANVASTLEAFSKSIMVSTDEFAKFSQYQESLKHSSSSVTSIVDSGNTTTYLLSSSSKWVIDSGATHHMIGSYDEEGYWYEA
ncbi:PREDICTED: uncharacterized protein LOC109178490 [Ipomoea nil]|uniref:uncharacterized protein LOC109178490 n=1 Tax=Ipomoea nil TaxID=35883 RepID=UPI000900ADA2|nr:PREDICTED: uncharacterized protein LOC109178490 [Ipomoea nil]